MRRVRQRDPLKTLGDNNNRYGPPEPPCWVIVANCVRLLFLHSSYNCRKTASRRIFLLLYVKSLHFFLYFVPQPVEDQGVHIPDQTVIKKGKQCSPGYHACFCLPPTPPLHARARTRAQAILLERTRCNAVMPD